METEPTISMHLSAQQALDLIKILPCAVSIKTGRYISAGSHQCNHQREINGVPHADRNNDTAIPDYLLGEYFAPVCWSCIVFLKAYQSSLKK